MKAPGLLCIALVAGCAASPAESAEPLADAIVAYEETEGGELLALPNTGIAEVDVNSRLVLRMREAGIRDSFDAGPDPSEVERVAGKLARLNELLKQLAAMLRSLHELSGARDPSPEMLQAHGAREAAFTEALIDYIENVEGDPEAADAVFSEAGYGKVQEYLQRARRQHEELMDSIDVRRWRVRASLRSDQRSTPVHVSNYDSLEAGPLDVRNKLVPVIDEGVKRELEEARKLSATVKDLHGFTELVSRQARLKLVQLEAALESIVGELAARVVALEQIRSARAAAGTLLTSVKSVIAQGKAAGTQCKIALGVVASLVDAPDPSALSATIAAAKSCGTELGALRSAAESARDAAGALASDAALGELAAQVEREVLAVASLDASLDAITQVLGYARKPLATPSWAEEAHFSDRRVGELVDARVDLTRTSRELGDHLTYQGLLVEAAGGGVLVEGPQRDLEVVQNGLQLKVSGALLFVSPFDLATNEEDFRALPALSAGFHVRCGRGDGELAPSGGCAFWNFLDPGLGASLVTVTLGEVSDDAAEAVATPHPSPALLARLFGDVVQGGAGFDFISSRWYWFFGLGIQTLTDLGFTGDL